MIPIPVLNPETLVRAIQCGMMMIQRSTAVMGRRRAHGLRRGVTSI
ncbi:hypothetical protein ACNKHP_24465 [Shigella boydii]